MAPPSTAAARRWLALHRRPVAAACAFLAVLSALSALTSPRSSTLGIRADAAASSRLTVPEGLLAVPLPLGDADLAAFLHPGDRVDVLVADGRAGATTVASDIIVGTTAGSSGGLWSNESLVVVLATPAQATALAAVATGSQVTIALRPG